MYIIGVKRRGKRQQESGFVGGAEEVYAEISDGRISTAF